MLLCMFLVTVATLLCGFAPSFHLLVIGRVIAGLAAGGVVPISFALVGDMIPVHERQVAMGRLLFAIMTGNLLGATCAGVVGDLVGWRGVFFVTGALGLAASIIAVPGFRGMSAATGTLRSVDHAAELSRDLPQSAGQDLFRHGVPGSRLHVRRLSLRRHHAARSGRDARLHRRHRHRRLRHRRRALWRAGVAPAAALGRAAHDAHRRRRARLLPAGDRGAALLAARVHEFRAARLRLLLSARGGADLRQRACAVRARLGHGAALILFLSRAGDRADRLRRRPLHHRLEPGAVDGRGGAGRGRLYLRALAAPAVTNGSRTSSRGPGMARRPGRAASRRPSAIFRTARTRRSACRRADTSSRRCADISA